MIIFGAGRGLYDFIEKHPNMKNKIGVIIDNDPEKIGKELYGIKIQGEKVIEEMTSEDTIFISSEKFFEEIRDDIHNINPDIGIKLLRNQVAKEFLPVIGRCNCCNFDIVEWLSFGQNFDAYYKIIGNGLRNCRCPYCGSIDRWRWVYWVLSNKTDIFKKDAKILHFAPEHLLKDLLLKRHGINYYTCDIEPGVGQYVVDITDIQFKDEYFDYIIANHIMEHIKDEKRAIAELKRCIKETGKIILSFPLCKDIDTLENDDYNTDELRFRYYGQNDHVRLYGKDFVSRFEREGLKVMVYSPKDYMSSDEIKQLCLQEDDIVLVCEAYF